MQLGAEDLYTCNMQAEGLIYRRACVFRTDKPFRWIGAVHEALVCDEPISVGHLSGLNVQAHSDGRSWSQGSRGKYLRHAEILLSAVERDGLPRDIFYLAQSYRDAGDYEAALHWYRKRALIPEGYLEERYYAQFMAGALGEQLGHPVQDVLFDYLKASEFDVLRAEHLLNAMLLLQKAGLWQAAHSLGADAVARFHGKAPLASRALFIDESTYAWKLQRVHQATLDALAGQVQGTASVIQTHHMLGFGEEQPAADEHAEHAGYRGQAVQPRLIERPGADAGDQRQRETGQAAEFAQPRAVLAGQHMHHFRGDVVGFGMRMFEHVHRALFRQAQGAAAGNRQRFVVVAPVTGHQPKQLTIAKTDSTGAKVQIAKMLANHKPPVYRLPSR